METRKIQLSGGTTYTVSLPKSWAEEHGIDEESQVTLHPKGDGSLLVEVTREIDTDDRRVVVDVTTTAESALTERIVALYQVGFDEITLRDRSGHPTDRRLLVEETISDLSGLELLDSSETRIQLVNLIDAENVDIRKSALRFKLVMLSMQRDAITAIGTGDRELAQRVVDRDTEADKLFAMITRHFRRSLTDLHEIEKLKHSREEVFEYYYVCRQFERVSDHAEKMASFVIDPEHTIPDVLIDHLEEFSSTVQSILDDAATVVLADGDIEVAYDVLDRRDALLDDIESVDRDLYDHAKPDAAYTAGLLLDSVRRSAQYGANIAEIGIQQISRTGGDNE
jgi:phosphate uptake regulator